MVQIPSRRRRASKARSKYRPRHKKRAAPARSKLPVYKLKSDRYRRSRVKAKLIDIYCANCGALALVYQKDAPREALRRCYIDRIFWPPKYEELQHTKRALEISAMPNLVCLKCGTIIGTPMLYEKHGEERLAYSMVRTAYIAKDSTHSIGRDIKGR